MSTDTDAIREVAHLLASGSRTLVITGAGVSRASGLPTYHGAGGIYTGFRLLPPWLTLSRWCMRWLPGLTLRTFRRAFERVDGVEPNDAHDAIAQMQAMTHVTVLTQNVDGLHVEAGSGDVIEIHGSARRFVCTAADCGLTADRLLDRCPRCGSRVRPDVVLFGEDLPREAVARLTRTLRDRIDLVLVTGTTCGFPYIRQAIREPRARGARVVFVDPDPTEFARVHAELLIRRPAEEVLPRLVNLAWRMLSGRS